MRITAIITVLLLAAASSLFAETIALVQEGKPVATIVIPAKPNEREKLAAQELQHYVKSVCGVELPIKEGGKKVEGSGLYIGQCEPTTEADLPAKDLNPETYAIHVRDGSVFFTGRYPTPTYFAVVSFIEDALGVRWLAPGEMWEYVPQDKPGELTVDVQDKVKVPDTSPRVWSGYQWTEDWKRWNLRNKTVLSEVVPRRQFQNFLYRVFPPEKYGKTHPEYYPLVKGNRHIPAPGEQNWRPCESNPEVQRLTIEYARKWFDEHPNEDSFSLGMDDISHLCGCPSCRAMDARPDALEKYEVSDRHYKFVNIIAREVAKTHPNRYIGTLIYACARKPPETVAKLEDNVFGYITEESASWWQKDLKQKDHDLTREWAKRCKHLSRYDYYGMGCITPRFYPHLMAEQIKLDKSLGLKGMYTEVYSFPANTAPMMWAFAKMQWDAKLDVDSLLDEFCAKMFGPAAKTMRRYYDLLERSWCTPRPGRSAWVHRRLIVQALAMSPEDVDEGSRLLDKAMNEVGATVFLPHRPASRPALRPAVRPADGAKKLHASPLHEQRIDVVRAGLQFGSYPIKSYGLSQKLMTMPIKNEAEAQEALRMALDLGRLSDERRRFWDEAMKRSDLLGETLRGLAAINYLVTGQAASVEGGAFSATVNALGWYVANAPDKMRSATAALTQNAPPSEITDLIGGWLSVVDAKAPNLVQNGGFEAVGRNEQRPEQDWKTEGAPAGWSTWSRDDKAVLKVLPGKGCHESAAATISNAGSACFLQNIPVNAGERYVCIAWTKLEPENLLTNAKLVVRFRQKGGGWYARQDAEPLVTALEGQGGWQLLTLVAKIPEGVGTLVVMLSANDQAEGATALFDDVAVYKLP